MGRVAIFDLDGTLLDSDAALRAAFLQLGVPAAEITYGHVVADECRRLGIDRAAYLAAYDPATVEPFPGVRELVTGLDRWAVCSNKEPGPGHDELDRLDWRPTVTRFADAFDGPKHLGPVLEALGCSATDVVYVGDTTHDRRCAEQVGCLFLLAGWNPRARADAQPDDRVLGQPDEVRAFLR